MTEGASRLAAQVDGKPLPEDEARALWKEFSEHMDANEGDMAGFAKKKGWASAAPEYRAGKAVLIVITSETARLLALAASRAVTTGRAGSGGGRRTKRRR